MDKTTHKHSHGHGHGHGHSHSHSHPGHRGHSHIEYDLHSDLERIKKALSDASYDVQGRANEMFNESKQHIKQTSSDLQDGIAGYIAEQPFKSMGLAILSGIVIGFLLRK